MINRAYHTCVVENVVTIVKDGLGLTQEEAERFVDNWFLLYGTGKDEPIGILTMPELSPKRKQTTEERKAERAVNLRKKERKEWNRQKRSRR